MAGTATKPGKKTVDSATAAVPSVGTAAGDELLTAETEAAVASVSGRDLDVDVVDEHGA